MTASHVVLVPHDFSEPAREALAWAFDYARRSDRPCEIHLVHVIEHQLRLSELTESGGEQLYEELRAIAEEAQTQLSRIQPGASLRGLHRHLASGRPAKEIVSIADRVGADLIVMGTHGRTGVRRAVAGSVAEHVVRYAPCTVVCVKSGAVIT